MNGKRASVSLTGLPSQILAIGGLNQKCLRRCENYDIRSNKWLELPLLNEARKLPGSILLGSLRALCFCGYRDSKLNSIESIQFGAETKWKVIRCNVESNYHLACASFLNSIVVFGGVDHPRNCTYTFDEEGRLLARMEDTALIPGAMCLGSFKVKKKKLFAVGNIRLKTEWKWRFVVYEGKKWSLL